jgi:FtsP/CotA-like multicopper oxidase with cupredoxin domain
MLIILGDNIVVHVTNNLEHNGTSVHWHGLRQLNTNAYDGTPGVTQCPIAPGETFTYRFQATQYGSTWFHSHFSLQYTDGLYGPLVINGPATADYDEDLGILFLSDWSHKPISEMWQIVRQRGAPSLENGLINGTNTYDCSTSTDPKCLGTGKRFETIFEAGRKYRIGLINVATNGHFQFSIDGHDFTVISNDLVPIVPYQASSVLINIGQRYDIIVEASAEPGDYWLRGGWQSECSPNDNAENITGIVRYDSTSTADPTTTGITVGDSCADEPLASLIPHLALDVNSYDKIIEETVGVALHGYLLWTLNNSSLYLNWSDPTNLKVYNQEPIFPTDYNVLSVEVSNPVKSFLSNAALTLPQKETAHEEWEVLVLQDKSGIP